MSNTRVNYRSSIKSTGANPFFLVGLFVWINAEIFANGTINEHETAPDEIPKIVFSPDDDFDSFVSDSEYHTSGNSKSSSYSNRLGDYGR